MDDVQATAGTFADTAAASESPAEHGARKVAVLLLRFSGAAEPPPWSESIVRDRVFTGVNSANALFREESHGAISLTGKIRSDGDIFGWYTVPVSGDAVCQTNTWAGQAREIAENSGVSLAGYDNLIYNFRSPVACGWSGLATAEGAFVATSNTGTFVHELGHNLGLWHAKGLNCNQANGARESLGPNCAIANYGDPFDVMGSGGMRRTNNWNLMTLGVLSSANLQRISGPGTYSLSSSFAPTNGVTNLQIPHTRGPNGEVLDWFDLETRQQGGIFEVSSDAAVSGVTVRLVADHRVLTPIGAYAENVRVNPTLTSSFGTLLIDAHPQTGSFFDAPVVVGQALSLDTAEITVLSVRPGSATVAVWIPGTQDLGPPSTPTQVSAVQSGPDVDLSWSPSADDVGVLSYAVFRDGIEIGASYGTSFTDPSPSMGQHAYTVSAKDLSGKHSASSSPAGIAVTDKTAPSIPTLLIGSQVVAGMELNWADSSDNVGVVRYLVFRDESPVGTNTISAFLDPSPPLGQHTYSVYAEDAAGNLSAPSAPKIIKVLDVQPPSAPAQLHAVQAAASVKLSWSPSTDNIGVTRYAVLRDGSEIGGTSGTGFIDPSPPIGQHTYVVHAEDAAHNRSQASPPMAIAVMPAGALSSSSTGAMAGSSSSKGAKLPLPKVLWHRRRNGTVQFEVDASNVGVVVGIDLMLDGRRLRSGRGATLQFAWNPLSSASCATVHRLVARANVSGGASSARTVRFELRDGDRRPSHCDRPER